MSLGTSRSAACSAVKKGTCQKASKLFGIFRVSHVLILRNLPNLVNWVGFVELLEENLLNS